MHGDSPGQIELNWMYDAVLRNAARLTTYCQTRAQVARDFGVLPIAAFRTAQRVCRFLHRVALNTALLTRW